MKKEAIIDSILSLYNDLDGNTVEITDDGCERKSPIYDPPLVGFGDAHDGLFDKYKKPAVIGPWHMSPDEWLPGAETVVSIFFPFSEDVRRSNRSGDQPSYEWLYGRIEGQAYIAVFSGKLKELIENNGIAVCVPSIDARFRSFKRGEGLDGYSDARPDTYGSRWSERHAAYVCGLGTFGLSKGLITSRGIAGRFTSLIISDKITPDKRPYSGIYDYCPMCGACAKNCPAGAITIENGKDHILCEKWLNRTAEKYAPRYGCGKCQTGVPCENCIPVKGRTDSASSAG